GQSVLTRLLPALEVREATFAHRLDAFLEVLRPAQPILFDELALGGGFDRVAQPAAYRLACRYDGKRRRLRDFERHRLSGAADFFEWHQQIGEPDPHRFVTGNSAPGVKQQGCLLHADEPRQSRSQSEAGMEAEPVEVGAESRLL